MRQFAQNIYKLFKKIIIFAALFLMLTGLSLTYRIFVKPITDPERPVFCFDEEGTCTGRGLSFNHIDVVEHNDKSEIIQDNWILFYDPENSMGSSGFLNHLTYGIVPDGYKELFPAKKLKLNTYYSVNFQNFFKIYQEDGKYKIETFNPTLDDGGTFEKAFPNSRLRGLTPSND